MSSSMKNLMHLEDLVFFHDREEVVQILSALLHHMEGFKIGQMTIKYDGAPALVFGNKEGFFLSNKAFFNKNPVWYRSTDEIEYAIKDPEHARKLTTAFRILKKERIFPGLTFYSDWLFDYATIGDKCFQPNIIEYHTKHSLEDYRLGLAVHSQEFGTVETASKWYSNNPQIYCAPVGLPKLEMPITKLFGQLASLPFYPRFEPKRIRELRSTLNTQVKNCSEYSVRDLNMPNSYLKLALDILIRFKYDILRYLDEIQETEGTYKLKINGDKATPEGYVFRYRDYKIKLVDRFGFSKRNFDPATSRGW